MPPRSGRGSRGGFGTGTTPRGRGGGKPVPVPQPQLQAQAQARNQRTQQPQPAAAARKHRVFQPGQRHMELIASVSRSSGLEKDGDALRDPKIQEEYRAFIQGKVDEYWKKYPLRSHRERASGHEGADADAGKEADSDADADARRNRMEMEENLLILFRKLREGLLSIHRRDAFALEVFETSLHLSVLFKSPVQTTSTLSHLFPDLYVNIRPSASTSTSTSLSTSTSTPSPSPSSNSPPTAGTPAPTSSTQTQQSDPRPVTQPSAPYGNPKPPLSPAPGPAPAPTAIQIPVAVPRSALASTLILLLHHLAQSYPSQIAFHTQLRQLHPALQDVLRAPPVPPPQPHLHPPSPSPSPAPRPSGLPSAAPWLPSAPAYESQQAAPSPQSDTSRTSSPSTGAGLGSGSHKIKAIASSAQEWVRELARCLRARNYARLEALTRREAYEVFVSQAQAQAQAQSNHPERKTKTHAQTQTRTHGESDDIANGASAPGAETGTHTPTPIPISESVRGTRSESLALEALGTLVETLLDKARGTTWAVLRSAYREVSLRVVPVAPANNSGTTGVWLARSLVLRGSGGDDDDVEMAERWLDGRRARGEARRKEGEGMEGRWVLVKA